jgi:hypothetical protein
MDPYVSSAMIPGVANKKLIYRALQMHVLHFSWQVIVLLPDCDFLFHNIYIFHSGRLKWFVAYHRDWHTD